MDFSNYMIVTDLDGTFLAKNGKGVPPRNREAIARFCAGGGRFTVATGRPHYTVGCAIPDVEELLNAPPSFATARIFTIIKATRTAARCLCPPRLLPTCLPLSAKRHQT